jgi:hypothetical protein
MIGQERGMSDDTFDTYLLLLQPVGRRIIVLPPQTPASLSLLFLFLTQFLSLSFQTLLLFH